MALLDVPTLGNLVANKILKNGMFSNNTAKHFSQRANKYNYAIRRRNL
jgi:hypothetical protein